MRATKLPSFKKAVEWIVCNDSPGDNDPPDVLAGLVTVCMVADLFGVSREELAKEVWKLRNPGQQLP